ncbi:MAG: (R)-hydratase [Alphaproteobacteria bacterium]|jgi:3-hydroxybutyryl-CoA dehydratase|nr:(R)-hydratase [Alphaproteobacteria bacterium]
MAELKQVFIEDITVGQSASLSKEVTEKDVEMFGEVSLDTNPVHFDQAYAEKTMFKTRIAHGMLGASLLSAVLGTQLPGMGTIYLGQTLKFKAPVKLGDTITATATVREMTPEKKRVVLDTVVKVGDTVVIDGEAQVLAPSRG